MNDVLDIILACFDSPEPVFSSERLATWDPAHLQMVKESGLLVETTMADHVECPDCPDGQAEEVMSDTAGAVPTYFIHCSRCGDRWPIAAEQLRRWTISSDGMAAVLNNLLGLPRCKVVVPGRLWRLGKGPVGPHVREAFLVRGLTAPGAEAAVAALRKPGRPVVFVAGQEPGPGPWSEVRPTFVSLARVLSLTPTTLGMDHAMLTQLVVSGDELASRVVLHLDGDQLRTMIDRGIRAHRKEPPERDAIINAYRLYGSARKAEAALRNAGFDIDHSNIARLVKKNKKKIVQGANSKSVRRAVALQNRDRPRQPGTSKKD